MKRILTSALFVTSLFSFGASVANSAVVVDQSFDPSNVVAGTSISQGFNRVYDDFSLTSATSLSTITIWASHWSSGIVPSVLDFRIDIFNDTGSSLGGLVDFSDLTVKSSIDTGYDHNNVSAVSILAYELSFDKTIDLGAGDYFLSVFIQSIDPSSDLAWQRINTNGRSIERIMGSPTSFGDLAWKLESASGVTPVPLPASVALLAGGLGMLGFFGRRRKKLAS
ncbi:PEP-CTERM sorting domain-containing protein [Roseibium album]|uniref:PEP-CTERM sorting domain-containing protein n=1 Tax=Roseibium album TaxID=311410 RepID=UPI00249264A6|nr:PEP-CTERM sorting domain-containing protein [Roseibium album]